MPASPSKRPSLVSAAFGAENRARLLAEYFASPSRPANRRPWEDVYRLLLWVDQTNALAHCYESDKSQPGKNWYARSLAFHDWLSRELACAPTKLPDELDWLFRRATQELTRTVIENADAVAQKAQEQRLPFVARNMPAPGEDPELVSIVLDVLRNNLRSAELSAATKLQLVQRVRQYLAQENRRKNLVGEGFEDVIAEVVRRHPGAERLDVRPRALLKDIPGFNRAREGDKQNKVDVAITGPSGTRRTLVTAKWSVRADREKQFRTDFDDYTRAESARKRFDYVWITNEFDPARLNRACEDMVQNSYLFAVVVHINPDALRATYGSSPPRTMAKVLAQIDAGRLVGFDQWVGGITDPPPAQS